MDFVIHRLCCPMLSNTILIGKCMYIAIVHMLMKQQLSSSLGHEALKLETKMTPSSALPAEMEPRQDVKEYTIAVLQLFFTFITS